jgi:hypothetical protein
MCGRREVWIEACRGSDTLPSTPCRSLDICGGTVSLGRELIIRYVTLMLVGPHLSGTAINATVIQPIRESTNLAARSLTNDERRDRRQIQISIC